MTTEQRELVFPALEPLIPGKYRRGATIHENFRVFNETNPHVCHAIRKISLDLKSRGFKKFGMKAIFERLRWVYAIQTTGEEYRLNNNFTSHYARLVMRLDPGLHGFFEIRGEQYL